MRIAVVGTGIAGLVCTHLLQERHEVTVFEAEARPGGHTHTVTVDVEGRSLAVDTGFLVYNTRTYPGLVRFFDRLGVATEPSDMSFSVSDEESGLEYAGSSFGTLFAQKRNLVNPAFLRMLVDVARFQRAGQQRLAATAGGGDTGRGGSDMSTAAFVERLGLSPGFLRWYLMPLGSSIWSADPETFLDMPATTLLRFFARHGMLSFGDKPTWRTVTGGAVHYVDAALAGVRSAGRLRLGAPVEALTPADGGVDLTCRGTTERFDHVVVATHSDQALAMLSDPTVDEKEILGSILYQRNDVTLHTDRTLLPRDRRCWASWNYHRPATPSGRVTMTYLLNRLQNLEGTTPVLVTLNRDEAIDPTKVLRRFRYSHPILDGPAVSAQRRHATIDNRRSISFCGAYWRDGFHEDGLQSALTVCRTLGATSW